jgi:hypothetical protein
MECRHSDFGTRNGIDLLALSRLCALGNLWPESLTAASAYVSRAPKRIVEGLSLSLRAQIRLGRVKNAIETATQIENIRPFSAEANTALDEIIDAFQYSYPEEALRISRSRQPLLQAIIHDGIVNKIGVAELRDLFTSALTLPVLLRFEHFTQEADREYSCVMELERDAGLGSPLAHDYLLVAYPWYPILGTKLSPSISRLSDHLEPSRRESDLNLVLLQPRACLGCRDLRAEFLEFSRRRFRMKIGFAIGHIPSCNQEMANNLGGISQLDHRCIGEAETQQLALLGARTHSVVVLVDRGARIMRIYNANAAFFRQGAGLEQLLARIASSL